MVSGKFQASHYAGKNNQLIRLAQAILDESEEAEREASRAPWWRYDRYGCRIGAWLLRHLALAICRWQSERGDDQ